jgi:hypothetical protein
MNEPDRSPLKLVAIGVLAAYVIAFVIANDDELTINFLFFSTDIALLVALILIGALGFAIGFLVRGSYDRRD